jgi:hypothetical protein
LPFPQTIVLLSTTAHGVAPEGPPGKARRFSGCSSSSSSRGSGIAELAARIATLSSRVTRKKVIANQSKPVSGAHKVHRCTMAPILPIAIASEPSTAAPSAHIMPVKCPRRTKAASRSSFLRPC